MSLSFRALSEHVGAEVRGVDLRRLSDSKFGEIYEGFLRFGVLVFPGQPLTIEQHLEFSRRFGALWLLPVHPDVPRRIRNDAIDDVSNLDSEGGIAAASSHKVKFALGNQLWHSDLSFKPVPAKASLLHAIEIADEGGETEFADLHGPYEALPPARKVHLEGLIAEHSLLHSRIRGGLDNVSEEDRAMFPPALQPIVRTHAETGRKGLYVGAHACRVVNMPDAEGAALLDALLEHSTGPEFTFLHRWAVGDLIIWDNRRVLHRGRPYDLENSRRVMHRATIAGEAATVVDGRIVVGV